MKEKCPECGSERLDKCNDGLFCVDCGFVLDDNPIDITQLGNNAINYQIGVSKTLIGNKIERRGIKIDRLNKTQNKLNSKERSWANFETDFDMHTDKLKLSNYEIKEAKRICKEIRNNEKMQSRTINSIIAVSVHLVKNISLRDLEKKMFISRREIYSTLKAVKKINMGG